MFEPAVMKIPFPADTVREFVELVSVPMLAYTAPKVTFELAPEAVKAPVVLEASK
jgi:hypothetical protein